MGLGPWEVAFVLILLVVLFGVGRLSQIGSAMGKSVRDFRTAVREEPVPVAPVVTIPPVICTACQTSNVGTNKFCSGCGATLANQVAVPAVAESQAQPQPLPATTESAARAAESVPSPMSEPSVLEGGHAHPSVPSASTNTCPSCATVNPPGQPFCGQCGTRLTIAAA